VPDPVTFTPIGVVRTPFAEHAGMPIQTVAASGVRGTVELNPAYADALADLDGFTHLHLLTHMHRTGGVSLRVTPYLDTVPRGVFATRSPRRPNPIGLSLVRLVRIDGSVLHVEELDLLDGTPLLDIKPYVPPFDDRAGARYGWFEQRAQDVHSVRADGRFADLREEEA
jgi:tRNA-Thr(GGU) m(6)t(6)A37 methyltransferase TsaA